MKAKQTKDHIVVLSSLFSLYMEVKNLPSQNLLQAGSGSIVSEWKDKQEADHEKQIDDSLGSYPVRAGVGT